MAITKLIADSITSGAIANTPAFLATLGSTQSVGDNSWTKANINTEIFDTDNCFDASTNYRFTPNKAGKYFAFGQIFGDPGSASDLVYVYSGIYKNGSFVRYSSIDFRNNLGREATVLHTGIFDMNGSSDYLELYGNVNANDGSGMKFNNNHTYFGAYKILT